MSRRVQRRRVGPSLTARAVAVVARDERHQPWDINKRADSHDHAEASPDTCLSVTRLFMTWVSTRLPEKRD